MNSPEDAQVEGRMAAQVVLRGIMLPRPHGA